jgi:hypothetical protein
MVVWWSPKQVFVPIPGSVDVGNGNDGKNVIDRHLWTVLSLVKADNYPSSA